MIVQVPANGESVDFIHKLLDVGPMMMNERPRPKGGRRRFVECRRASPEWKAALGPFAHRSIS